MPEIITNNLFFGRRLLSSKFDKSFIYKDVSEYSLSEWIENVFISPWENSSNNDGFCFMDKRSGVNYSLMSVSMPHEQVQNLRDNDYECYYLLRKYFEKRFHFL